MEPITESDKFRKQFIQRQQFEDEYRKIDSSERIQKAMAQRVYGYVDQQYEHGEEVLFKEEGKEKWSGPGKVIGVVDNKVKIMHMGYGRIVPTCRVMPYKSKRYIIEENDNQDESFEEKLTV